MWKRDELYVSAESTTIQMSSMLTRGLLEQKHLQQLISQTPAQTHVSASPYLYLAQTALSPQEALQHYESALQVLQRRLEGMQGVAQEDEEETEQEVRKECVMAFVAMVEIWMSDLWQVSTFRFS